MPEIHAHTPRETYTIAGESFKIAQPYKEGHSLTSGEASQLNQVFAENIRNNQAKKVTEHKDAGTFDPEVFQAQLDDYQESYEMGVRTGGGRTGDPVMAEALSIARDAVRRAVVAAGIKLANVSAKQITEKAKEAIESNPKILEIARTRVEAAKGIADLELGRIEEDATPAEAATPAAKGKGKAAA